MCPSGFSINQNISPDQDISSINNDIKELTEAVLAQNTTIHTLTSTIKQLETTIESTKDNQSKEASVIKQSNEAINSKLTDLLKKTTHSRSLPIASSSRPTYSRVAERNADGNRSKTLFPIKKVRTTVNPEKTLIITGITSHELINNSSTILKTFNRYYPDVKLSTYFSTKGGSVMIELENALEGPGIVSTWDPRNFTTLLQQHKQGVAS